MLVTKFQLDAMSRADIPEHERVDFYLYVDEFQNFATDSFATILSEARKYKLNLVMANQYIDQMQEEVK
jgi:type IV secretory pathway TraG/TraD family ATPase VirD4